MSKRTFILAHAEARQRAIQAVKEAPDGFSVTIMPQRRSTDQNSALWPLLEAFSQQRDWPINGRMEKLTPEEWKDILSAAFRQELARVAPGINGGMVMLGARTSRMTKAEFSEFLEFIHSVAAERQVTL